MGTLALASPQLSANSVEYVINKNIGATSSIREKTDENKILFPKRYAEQPKYGEVRPLTEKEIEFARDYFPDEVINHVKGIRVAPEYSLTEPGSLGEKAASYENGIITITENYINNSKTKELLAGELVNAANDCSMPNFESEAKYAHNLLSKESYPVALDKDYWKAGQKNAVENFKMLNPEQQVREFSKIAGFIERNEDSPKEKLRKRAKEYMEFVEDFKEKTTCKTI